MTGRAKSNILVWILGIICSVPASYAQDTSYQSDSTTVYALGNRAFSLRTSKPDSALLIAREALQLAETIRDTQALVNLWRIMGVVHYGQRRMEEAQLNFTRSYELARTIRYREGRLLINLGNVEFYRQDYKKALDRYQEALELSAQQDTVVWMDALNNIGSVCTRLNRYDQAAAAFRHSLALQRSTGNERAQLPTLVNLGEAYRKLNQTDRETATFQEGLQLATALSDSIWMASFYRHIGRAYSNRAFYPQSLAALQQALSIYTDQEDSLAIAQTLHNIGVLQFDFGNFTTAIDRYREALAIYTQHSDRKGQANCFNSIGRSLLLQKQYQEARNSFYQSISLYSPSNPSIRYPFFNLAESYEAVGQLDSAAYYLNAAHQTAAARKDYYLESLSLTGLGNIARQRNAPDEAIALYKEAIAIARLESMRQEELKATRELYQVMKQQDRPKEALAYLERSQVLQDSLFNEESTRKFAQLEAQYIFDQEKKEIADRNAAEKRQLDEQIQQQRTWQIILGSALILSILALFLIYRFQQFRKSATLEQERLNHQINLQKLAFEQKERERLQEMDNFKSRFFANISHELRTPLTLILSPIQRLLKSVRLNPQERTQLHLVRENARFLLKRVNEILDLTKFEARQMQLQETPTAFYDFCKRLAANFESFAQQKSQQYLFEYRLDKDLNILLDRTKFTHVFNNYLSNAIKYTPDSGKVQVALYQQNKGNTGHLVLEVKDNGTGIRPKDLPHLFDRFYQGNQEENKAGGSGIGLALSKEVAQAMGAEVWVKSEWGKGSTFYFEFPCREVMGVLPEPAEETTSEPDIQLEPLANITQTVPDRPKILVVEDNKQLRDYLHLILSDHYQVLTANHGEHALRKLSDWNAQLIISDVMMPKMDGFELLAQLKNSDVYRHIPVIMLTARSEMQDKLKALRIGVDDYLLKPFIEDELLTRIRNLLKNYQTRKHEISKELPHKPDLSAADLRWLEKLEGLLKKEVSNPDFTFDQLEDQLFISRSQLQRRIKKITGLTPNKYFREIKLQMARELLESGRMRTVNEVAYAVGFDTTKYFSKIYAQRFGTRPVEWL